MNLTRKLDMNLMHITSAQADILGLPIGDEDGRDSLRADRNTRRLLILLQSELAKERRRSGLLIKAADELLSLEGHAMDCDRRYDPTRYTPCTCAYEAAQDAYQAAKDGTLLDHQDTQRGGLLS